MKKTFILFFTTFIVYGCLDFDCQNPLWIWKIKNESNKTIKEYQFSVHSIMGLKPVIFPTETINLKNGDSTSIGHFYNEFSIPEGHSRLKITFEDNTILEKQMGHGWDILFCPSNAETWVQKYSIRKDSIVTEY